jgi:hypothetical protein
MAECALGVRQPFSLTLQPDEAAALEALLDMILTNEAASAAVFADGGQRRKVKRASMKLHWAKCRAKEAQKHFELTTA